MAATKPSAPELFQCIQRMQVSTLRPVSRNPPPFGPGGPTLFNDIALSRPGWAQDVKNAHRGSHAALIDDLALAAENMHKASHRAAGRDCPSAALSDGPIGAGRRVSTHSQLR